MGINANTMLVHNNAFRGQPGTNATERAWSDSLVRRCRSANCVFAMPVHSTCFPEASPVGIPWRGLGQIVFQSAAGQQIVYGFGAARFEK